MTTNRYHLVWLLLGFSNIHRSSERTLKCQSNNEVQSWGRHFSELRKWSCCQPQKRIVNHREAKFAWIRSKRTLIKMEESGCVRMRIERDDDALRCNKQIHFFICYEAVCHPPPTKHYWSFSQNQFLLYTKESSSNTISTSENIVGRIVRID